MDRCHGTYARSRRGSACDHLPKRLAHRDFFSDEDLPDLTGEQPLNQEGSCIVQVLPSGPANRVEAIEQVLLTAIYSARKEIVITSPYFVPSESLQMALASAAQRGVQVTVIVPKKVDSILVRYASRAFRAISYTVAWRSRSITEAFSIPRA